MSTATAPAPSKLATWRTPLVLIAVGCAIALIAFGPRSALGQFLTPLSFERGWGREAFSFAIAMQNLLWGAAQPFAGGIADRFGPMRVLCAGAILYAAGLAWMAIATSTLDARSLGRRADRLRPRRLLVPDGGRRARQARAGELALVRVRRRHRRGLVRPVPVLAARACADRRVLLADRAAGLRRHDAAGAAAVAGAGDAAGGSRAPARRKPQSSQAGAGRGVRPSQLRAAGARLLHLRLPARLRHRAPAVLSGRPRARRRRRRLDHRLDRPVQHRRLAGVGLARRPDAEALSAVDHLFRPRARDRRLHHAAGEHDRRR